MTEWREELLVLALVVTAVPAVFFALQRLRCPVRPKRWILILIYTLIFAAFLEILDNLMRRF